MFTIWWQLVHFQRSYNLQKKIDGPKFADPSIAAVNLRRLWFVRNNYGSMAAGLPLFFPWQKQIVNHGLVGGVSYYTAYSRLGYI